MFEEPRLLRLVMDAAAPMLADGTEERQTGPYLAMGNLITGAGWLSAGPGYRQWLGRRAFVDASAEVSWRLYKQAQARVEMPALAGDRLAVGAQLLWQDLTQVRYFGRGPNQPGIESEYRAKLTDITAFATWRATTWLAVDGHAGWLDRPTISSGTGWYGTRRPPPEVVFPNEPGVGVRPPSYVHGEVSLTADTRDQPGYPARGAMYRLAAAKYADKDLGTFAFAQYQVEGVQFVPLLPGRWLVALHGWGVFTQVADGHELPFYMLPSLGGANTLRGDRNYRWHDRHLLLTTIESRFGVFEHMDATVFVDAGNVAPNPGALNLARRSLGAGVRIHTRTSTLLRLDVAHGRAEGWRVMLKLNDPLRLSRLGRRAATLPFVP